MYVIWSFASKSMVLDHSKLVKTPRILNTGFNRENMVYIIPMG